MLADLYKRSGDAEQKIRGDRNMGDNLRVFGIKTDYPKKNFVPNCSAVGAISRGVPTRNMKSGN
jgi:hypothetical protein